MTDRPLPPVEPSGAVRPVDLRDYVRFSAEQATRIRVFATGVLALDLWCLEPQQATPVLRYERSDVTYTVIAGRSWFVTEDGEVGLDALGSLLVPSGVTHGIDDRGADPLIVLASSAPPTAGSEDEPVADDAVAIRPEPRSGGVRRTIRTILRGQRSVGSGPDPPA